MNKRAAVGFKLVAVLAAAGFAIAASRRGPAARDPAAAGATQRRWALELEVKLEQPGGGQPVQMRLTGEWLATVTAERAGERDVAHEVANAQVTGDGASASPAEIETLRQRLSQRFWITYRDDGAAVRAAFPRDLPPSERNLLLTVATDAQLVRPRGAAEQWTATERDGAGLYLAGYRRSAGAIVKRKLKYLEVDGAAGAEEPGGLAASIVASERRFALDAQGRVAAFDGHERVRVGMPIGGAGWLEITTKANLSAARDAVAPELWGSLERARAEVESGPIRTQQPDAAEARAARDRKLLAGRTTEELLAAAHAEPLEPQLRARLAALFRLRPEAVALAKALLRSAACKPLSDGLGAAGTSAAAVALRELAHDATAPAALRIDALTGLSLATRPPAEALQAPAALLDDRDATVRRAAFLIAGTLARGGRAEHQSEADAIDHALVARFDAAAALDERAAILAALGNSSGPMVTPVLRRALGDPSAAVRAAAARALRLSQEADADALLAARLTGDAEAAVRLAAIFAASFRPIDPLLPALVKAATADASDSVRTAAVQLLRQHPDASPQVRRTLAEVAAHDARPGLRRLAAERANQ